MNAVSLEMLYYIKPSGGVQMCYCLHPSPDNTLLKHWFYLLFFQRGRNLCQWSFGLLTILRKEETATYKAIISSWVTCSLQKLVWVLETSYDYRENLEIFGIGKIVFKMMPKQNGNDSKLLRHTYYLSAGEQVGFEQMTRTLYVFPKEEKKN